MLVSKLKFFYFPGMVFRSSEEINYFSFSGHTRRRPSCWRGVPVMSIREPRAATWSAYTHALALRPLARCRCRLASIWWRVHDRSTCSSLRSHATALAVNLLPAILELAWRAVRAVHASALTISDHCLTQLPLHI